MGSFLSLRVRVSGRLGMHKEVVFLLSIFIASMQCSDSSHYHGHRATKLQPLYYSQHLRSMQHGRSVLEVEGQLALRNYGVGAAAGKRHLATSAQNLMVTSRTRAYHSKEVKANLNDTERAPDMEVKALAGFKAALSRDPLHGLSSWNVSSTANDSEVCGSWAGVTCSPQYPYHVVALILPNLQLVGDLSTAMLELAHLPFLQRLDLSMNAFSGFINGEALTNSSSLSYFNISNNLLTGAVPSEVGELVSLQDLDASVNNLTGPLPSLVNCSVLRLLNLGENFLQGNVPSWLGTLSNLSFLVLGSNTLSGDIPTELGNCSSLSYLDVSDNYLLGPQLPDELTQLPLRTLWVDRCSFAGSVPTWIGNFTTMQQLSLSYNSFQGEIPDTIGQLGLLGVVNLGGNQFTGPVPLSILNCTFLVELTMESNLLTGDIPQQIGSLANLQVVSFGENNFTGVIPSSFDNCSELSTLELGLNELMDPQPFPSWIGKLTNLQDIYFTAMNLQGAFPEGIGNLSNLQQLYLGGNNLHGYIPSSLGNCTFLSVLDLHSSNLTGSIPSDLGLLSYMAVFDVGGNYLTGPFPSFFVNWAQLSFFFVSTNFLSGTLDVPATVGNLLQLGEFQAGDNDFEGPIPETLGNSSITQLYLFENNLNGTIPSSLMNMTNLQYMVLMGNQLQGPIPGDLLSRFGHQFALLDLSGNFLEGSIPSEIGHLSGLAILNLSYNSFSGIIPSSLGNCSNMNILDLSYNKFEGIAASAISTMFPSLRTLVLSNNPFSGPWPIDFTKFINIQAINISANNISASLPVGLGNCVSLESLDISTNHFTGEIPQELGELSKLQYFNASFNDLDGAIPQSGFFNSNLVSADSFLGNPALCGPANILGPNHQECPRNVTGRRSCNGFKCDRVWIPVTAAVILLVSVLLVLIVARIKLRWTLRVGSRTEDSTRQDSGKLVMLNFGTHVRFTEADVLRTISDPSEDNIIGRGATSIVYKGVQEGGGEFALKKVVLPEIDSDLRDSTSNHRGAELVKEAETLANFIHRNILKCLAFYSKLDLRALILEFMCEGSLHDHLHDVQKASELKWQTRLKIAVGVAQGMVYLHHEFPEPIIHRDLKPSNILLDADFEPKISDFGISKFVNPLRSGEVTASTCFGTIGYMPPEYSSTLRVSTKGDVYSYGMVLLELLTRRHPASLMTILGHDGKDLRTLVLNDFHERPYEFLDPFLLAESRLDKIVKEQIMLLLRVSLFCTRVAPRSRPSMINVVGMLKHIVDYGVDPVTVRTLEELANDSSTFPTEDPSSEGADIGSGW